MHARKRRSAAPPRQVRARRAVPEAPAASSPRRRADSAPLFYFAPGLRTLVALDPTFFYARDPALFSRYIAIAFGRSSNPGVEIRQRFGARYVTVWKAPVFSRLATGLSRDPGAARVYEDSHYQVWELSPAPGP